MKVGDLVMLSSYGKSVKSINRFVKSSDLGVITGISSKSEFPYEVRWISTHHNSYDLRSMIHSRQDLKYASRRFG